MAFDRGERAEIGDEFAAYPALIGPSRFRMGRGLELFKRSLAAKAPRRGAEEV